MPEFLKTLSKAFPNIVYGLTSFVEYQYLNKANPSLGLEEGAYCYVLEQKFTKDHAPIIDRIPAIKIQTGGGDGPETSLTALLYTATEKNIGWYNTSVVKGKKVYKIIALTTDERWKSSFELGTEPFIPDKTHKPPKGDGTDDCENAPPDPNLVRKVLEKKGFHFIGLIAPGNLETWKGYMSTYQFKPERNTIVGLSPADANNLAKTLVDQFMALIKADQCGH